MTTIYVLRLPPSDGTNILPSELNHVGQRSGLNYLGHTWPSLMAAFAHEHL